MLSKTDMMNVLVQACPTFAPAWEGFLSEKAVLGLGESRDSDGELVPPSGTVSVRATRVEVQFRARSRRGQNCWELSGIVASSAMWIQMWTCGWPR